MSFLGGEARDDSTGGRGMQKSHGDAEISTPVDIDTMDSENIA